MLFLSPRSAQNCDMSFLRMVTQGPFGKSLAPATPPLTPTRSGYTPALRKEAFQLSTSSCVSQASSSCR